MKQHEPLRVPEGWQGQARSFVMQLERILDEVYMLIGKSDERTNAQIAELKERIEALEEETT